MSGWFLIVSFSILGFTLASDPFVLYLLIVLLGIFGSGHTGLSDTMMVEMIPPERREETAGFILTLRMGAGSLSPLVVGYSAERLGMGNTFLILAVIPLITALLVFLIEDKQEG